MDIELKTVKVETNGNDGTAGYGSNERVTAGNGGGHAASETDGLLTDQMTGRNGNAAETQGTQGHTHTPQKNSSVKRIKRELNEVIFCGARLWMVIIFMFLLILAVIIISLAVCSAVHEDVDEKYDATLFKVPRHFNGSFRLPHQVFTEELLNPSSNKSQALTAHLQRKLADPYRSSPALERYFSTAKISAFRNGSVIADYQLTFLMPAEQQHQLRNFTLSREMVYNVFRQFLYDQDTDESEAMYIDPVSLKMF